MKAARIFAPIILGNLILATGCASTGAKVRLKSSDSGVQVQDASGEKIAYAPGEEIVADRPVLVEAPGKISVLVVPTNSKEAIDLRLKTQSDWLGHGSQSKAQRIIEDVLPRVNVVQILLAKKQGKEALNRTRELLKDYPKITFLKFLEASCHFVLNDVASATRILERTIPKHPNFEPAQILYKRITGKQYRVETRKPAAVRKETRKK